MPWAIFLRGTNVGGARVFSPAAFAKSLGLENLGAAGTFVARTGGSAAAVRDRIAKALPFETEVLVVAAADVAALVASEPFRGLPKDAKPTVTVLSRVPKSLPRFPADSPAGAAWEVRLFPPVGTFVPGCYRAGDRLRHYPNEVVEKLLGVPATTRGWPTILKLHAKVAT